MTRRLRRPAHPDRWSRRAALLATLLLTAAPLGSAQTRPAAAGSGPAADPADPGPVLELPLTPRGPGPVGTRFARRATADSGLDFVHHWRPEQRYLHVLGNAMAGGGVAVGDADGDGLPEVVLTRPYGGTRLYRNTGALTFVDATAEAALLPDLWGGGACFADLDDDGQLDLLVCGYDTPVRLYWNRGDGRFDEGAAAAGLAFSGAAVMAAPADHDLDGDLDVFVLTNRFAPRETPDQPVPYQDGRLVIPDELAEQYDVLARPDGQTVMITAGQYDHLYRNDGGRRFTDVSAAAGIDGNHYGLSATWWDPDLDGWPDLYVANDFYGPDRFYSNQRDGRFVDVAPSALAHTPWFSMGADAADIDNDGLIDLFSSDMSGTTHERRQVTMTDLAEGAWFLEAAVPRQYMRNALQLNTGSGRFAELALAAGVARSDWTWSTVFGDLDDDGWQDLFISNGMTRDYFHYDRRAEAAATGSIMDDYWVDQDVLAEANLAFRNEGDLSFSSRGAEWGLDHVAASFGATLADLDRDGDLDVIGNDYEAPAFLFENQGADGHVLALELRASTSDDGPGRGGRRSAGDDGRRASSTNRFGVGARVTVHSRGPDGATRRQVRELFPSRGYMAGAEPRLHVGLGDHAVIERVTVDWPGGGRQVVEGLEVDHAYRITQSADALARVAPGPGEPTRDHPAAAEVLAPTALFRGVSGPTIPEQPYDDFKKQPLLPARLSGLGPPLAAGDVDGDGDEDLYIGGPAGTAGQLFLVEAGNLAPAPADAFALDDYKEDACALFVDADADGDLDLYVASGGVEGREGSSIYRDRLYLNDGAGLFASAGREALPADTVSEGALAAADLDGDGDLDLFLGSRTIPGRWPARDAHRLLRNDGDGTFSDATADWAPASFAQDTAARLAAAAAGEPPMLDSFDAGVTAALFADVDADGDADLVVAHDWGCVVLWPATDGRLGEREPLSFRGWWSSLAVGDPDHDGDLDLLAGNLGVGSRTRATTSRLYWGDLDESGVHTLAEVALEGDRWVPVRTRADVMGVRPFLADDFPTYADYAHADAGAVFGPFGGDGLTGPFLAADEERSVLLRNTPGTPGRRFTAEPLPPIAQLSPVFGAAFTELDGDGHPDILLVQNSFAPQAEHGRLDGGLGLALRGDGAGGFTPLRADASGVVIPGDAKALVLADLDEDGWPDALASQNDGPLHFLLRDDPPPGRLLAVRLAGPPGNPTGVGATITFTHDGAADGDAEDADRGSERRDTGDGATSPGRAAGERRAESAAATADDTPPPQTVALTAGSGYRGQSAPVAWFGRAPGRSGILRVRWPDGGVSRHAVAADESALVLKRP